ncbi:TonB-dependent receptor plug domain-containing protein [Pseudohongiella sp.]|uniref:TonB-dependent receptor plug domain-containing protein n=1 Tax=marine sediment metagenome TaxID=412755 RepID=A0A0F9W2I1_9ZZZZ|nr:TonB-dependent receptor [Pseudohongiella sp.]
MTRSSIISPIFRVSAQFCRVSAGFFRTSAQGLLLISLTNTSLLASADEIAATGVEDSTIIYPASFFQPYNPVSVNDMIDRIPGVSISDGGGGRGLGSGGDLLINGQRLAGKDNSPRDQLRRIAAREVDRIEIIRGTSSELAVRGSGQVVNVVLQDADTRASTSVEISTDRHADGTLQPGASISHSRQSGNLTAIVSLQADPQYGHEQRLETSYSPDLTATEIMTQSQVRDRMAYQASTVLGYRTGQHRMQLNALYGTSDHPVDISRQYRNPESSGVIASIEREPIDNVKNNWELGGDYEYEFDAGGNLLVLFIVNDETDNSVRERFLNDDPQSGAADRKSLYIQSNSRTRERIAQGTYSWSLAQDQDLQLGAERAQTILDSSLLIGRDSDEAAPSPLFGNLAPALNLSNLGSSVEEMRYEGFAVHNWTLNDRMTLESSLVYETSEISQSGALNQSRDFQFWRPSVDYRFNITNSLQLRATVARQVQQLSFANFTATANTDDNDKDADAGNPNLVPTKEVRYELTMEYRLPNDAGVVSSRFFLRDLEDQIGRINASANPDQPVSAAGNIGDAKRWGVYLDGSTRLGALGLPDAIVSSSLYLFDSEVTNPILGTTERINGRGRAQMGFRHDVVDWNLNYGFDYNHPLNGGERNIEVNTIDRTNGGPNLTMFVSTVLFDDVTFRLESNNTLDEEYCRNRVRYSGSAASGNISELEDACWGYGRKLALKVRKTF